MDSSVPKPPPLQQVAIAARLRATSVTPPAPRLGESMFDSPLPTWLYSVTPLSSDVLYTTEAVLPLTKADWIYVDGPTEHTSGVDEQGRAWHQSRATSDAHTPRRHPSEAPRSADRIREEWIAEAWGHGHALALALVNAGVGSRGTGHGAMTVAETVFHLARGAVRDPGVPIFDRIPLEARHGFGFMLRSPQIARPGTRSDRSRAWIRRVECAASHDLVGAPFARLSQAQGWKDHETHDGQRGPATQAKRAVREGRTLLHKLGAWPWAHAELGRLGNYPEWWADERFLDPLRRWIGLGWGRLLLLESHRARQAFELEPSGTDAHRASEIGLRMLHETAAQIAVLIGLEDLQASLTDPPD